MLPAAATEDNGAGVEAWLITTVDLQGARSLTGHPMRSALAAAMPDLSVRVDMDVVDVLLGLDRLACGLAEHHAQLSGSLFPLAAGQTL